MAVKVSAAAFVQFLIERWKAGDGYIMGATGQNPRNWSPTSWWFTQYSGSQRAMDYGSGIKAAGTTSAQLNAAYIKLIRAALREFSENHIDLPPITVSVNFLLLGDTAEYAQYRDLQKLFLYDTVRVKHPRLGIDVTTQVNKTVWDCLLDRYDSIELGSVRKNYARSKLAGWMIPGYDSLRAYVDTVTSAI